MGERGQSPLLYLGSPYLDFLDMDVSADGTHSPTLTHSPQVQYTGTQDVLPLVQTNPLAAMYLLTHLLGATQIR